MELIKIKVEKNQEVINILEEEFKKRNLQSGAIVSIIGAIDECCISNMPKQDAMKDILTEYKEPMELSGTGEIRDGKPHIHCVLGRAGNETVSGHLHWAKIKSWYVAIYLII
jgi:hypothetical protein